MVSYLDGLSSKCSTTPEKCYCYEKLTVYWNSFVIRRFLFSLGDVNNFSMCGNGYSYDTSAVLSTME